MRRIAAAGVAAALLAGAAPAVADRPADAGRRDAQQLDLARHVDPMIGTLAPGFVVPGASTPFGMTQVSPDTGGEVAYSGYTWHDPQIRGFSHVHLSGPGVKKAGEIPLLPTTGPVLSSDWRQYASAYDHATERAEAGYYGVRLDTYGVDAEMTATPRTGLQRYTFPPVPQANVLLDVGRNISGVHESAIEVVGDRTVRGHVRGRYPVFFEAQFDRPFTATGTWTGAALAPGSRAAQGTGVGGWVSFDAVEDRTVEVKVGISFVDAEGARRNLAAEQQGFDVEGVRAAARAAWNRELARVQVSGGAPGDLTTFYTALYHALLHPNVFKDVDGRHLGHDGAVRTSDGFTQYTNFSSWDTYKGQNQLLATVWPDRYRDMLLSLLQIARERGHLPRWAEQNLDPAHMSGDPAIPLVVDGFCRGVLDDVDPALVDELYAEMVELVDRRETAWHDKGYLPLQTSSRGAGTTLEYGVADFALAVMADATGRPGDADRFAAESRNYRALLDPETRWIRPRNADGSWHSPFDPALDETGFQEGNAWQYSWLAPHDARGLYDLMGGDAAVVERLDHHFLEPAAAAPGPAEVMNEATFFGVVYRTPFYAPGNEHDLQTPWMYPYARRPWKTAAVHRQVQGVFRPTIDGLPGNDDLGGLSGWYVWSALGLGPVTPGAPFYVLGSPRFDRAVLDLPGARDVVVESPGASTVERYVTAATLGGEPLDRAWLTHDELRRGGRLELDMSATPSSTWATSEQSVPPSLSDSPLPAFGCAS
ncbi:MAG TPA: GH92 family glycosyl hydrolase [Mycobacteriales bacterium]|nr:GH92 family glycosyl hydrolase [Mycobacteriales bacterium]